MYIHVRYIQMMKNAFEVLMGVAAKQVMPVIKRQLSYTSSRDTIATPMNKASYVLMFDGGSRGNPGLCGAGAVIYIEGMEVWAGSQVVSVSNTNNYAEYSALNMGLKQALEMDIDELTIFGDSELIMRQMTGQAKVKSPNLLLLHKESMEHINKFENVDLHHVLRKFNKRADQLANEAMDTYMRKISSVGQ